MTETPVCTSPGVFWSSSSYGWPSPVDVWHALREERDILPGHFARTLYETVAGFGLAIGLNQYLVSKVELARLPISYVVSGMIAALGLGILAVLGPAWRAASTDP